MKIVSLNTWDGFAGMENLLSFFKKYNNKIDVFCLQEIFSNASSKKDDSTFSEAINVAAKNLDLYQDIQAILKDYDGYFCSVYADVYGIAMFVKKDIQVIENGEIIIYENKKFYDPENDDADHTRKAQWLKLEENLNIINIHGHWDISGKRDTENRLKQSDTIINLISQLKGETILCGDFNLLPDTESIKKIERSGLRNLIKEYGITSTRTSFYKKPEKYADYAFINKDVNLKDFKVLPDEVSDHFPLYLEIN